MDSTKVNSFKFRFKKGDIIAINVSSIDAETAKPFNLEQTTRNTSEGYQSGFSVRDGYLIDDNGEINFPVIGKIKLVDLDRIDANNLMVSLLKEYIKEPIVNIRLSNFKITVLGSVTHAGTFNIPNERVTIFEALGLANDLKITGVRKNVLVVRDENGVKKEIRLDITSKQVYSSEAYYLEQNDIVYVEPNLNERFSSTIFKSSGIIIVSIGSIFLTTLNLLLN